jgi:hypothetical protein
MRIRAVLIAFLVVAASILERRRRSHSISGWTVRDAAGHVYKFGTLRL